jgi:serine protease Do
LAVPPVRRFAATCLFLALSAYPAAGVEGDPGGPAIQAVARARPSVVSIRALGKGRDGYGAGIVVRGDGLIMTALHVVKDATALAIVFEDGEEHPGKLLAADEEIDVALVRTVAPGRTFSPARFGSDAELELGESLVAIANPFGLGISVTRGILSARERRNVVGQNSAGLLQTDAAINPGSSGGALVNLNGELVGLIVAILTRTGGHQGIGFAVPAYELERALPYLLRGEPVRRPWLGVRVTQTGQGLRIKSVVPAGPASNAGLRAGDTLLRLKGKPLLKILDLRRLLRRIEVGAPLRADFLRDGKVDSVEVRVGLRARRAHGP